MLTRDIIVDKLKQWSNPMVLELWNINKFFWKLIIYLFMIKMNDLIWKGNVSFYTPILCSILCDLGIFRVFPFRSVLHIILQESAMKQMFGKFIITNITISAKKLTWKCWRKKTFVKLYCLSWKSVRKNTIVIIVLLHDLFSGFKKQNTSDETIHSQIPYMSSSIENVFLHWH